MVVSDNTPNLSHTERSTVGSMSSDISHAVYFFCFTSHVQPYCILSLYVYITVSDQRVCSGESYTDEKKSLIFFKVALYFSRIRESANMTEPEIKSHVR